MAFGLNSKIATGLILASFAGYAHAKDANQPVVEALASQIASCWTAPAETSVVAPILTAHIEKDGSVRGVLVANHSEDPAFKINAEMARRAVMRCAPFDLSKFANSYEDWRELTLNFSSGSDIGPAKRQNKETGAVSLMPNFKSDGKTANGFAHQATSWDDREVMVMFMCMPVDKKNGYAIGVDFGVGRDETKPQNVTMMYGWTTSKKEYVRVGEYLGFEGSEAARHLKAMANANGYLEFAGENGHSAFFKFDDMREDFDKFLDLCDLKS